MGSSNDMGVTNDAARRFRTTSWSLVSNAASGDASAVQMALEELCQAYWFPIYAFARRQGNNPADAADLSQGFFLQLLDGGMLDAANPDRGRFRTFLLASFQNFCRNAHRDARTLKRGGDLGQVSIDVSDGESKYGLQAATRTTAESEFERQWALALLDRVYERLEAEFRDAGRQRLFDAVKHRLTGVDEKDSYREIADRLEIMETAVKVAVHRMRARFRELLREEVLQTLGDPAEVDDEILRLFSTFEA